MLLIKAQVRPSLGEPRRETRGEESKGPRDSTDHPHYHLPQACFNSCLSLLYFPHFCCRDTPLPAGQSARQEIQLGKRCRSNLGRGVSIVSLFTRDKCRVMFFLGLETKTGHFVETTVDSL
jgi:hypothetical protein